MTSRSYTMRRLFARLSVGFLQTALAVVLFLFVFSGSTAVAVTQEKAKMVSFDIPAGDAVKALKQFSAQSGQQLLYSNEELAGVSTNEVKGRLSVQEALDQLLAKTPLAASRDDSNGAVAVGRKADPNAQRLAQKNSDQPKNQKNEAKEGVLVLDTFEVMGSKLLNMDIPRSRNDAQPYVIFNRGAIEQSGATNLEDFLKQRLTMNTMSTTYSQSGTFQGNMSQINLRGLGTSQTLILVDGHRVASPTSLGVVWQPDLNGIPLAAIDRIEVLPTTASGIYGGSATGGVVNIILRRDYAGGELKATYENTFHTDAAQRRVSLSAGFNLEGGKTNVLLAASYSDSNVLATRDRDFVQRGRAIIAANNPAFFPTSATPVLGATPNIRSSNGSNLVLKNGTPLNSPVTFVPYGYTGVASDGGVALLANAGRHNLELADSDQQPGGLRQALMNAPRIESVMVTVRRQFSPKVQAFFEAAASNNISFFPFSNLFGSFTVAASSPTNPFTQAILVTPTTPTAEGQTYSSSFDRRMVGGIILKLPKGWIGEADYTWNRSRLDASQPTGPTPAGEAAMSNGTLNLLVDPAVVPVDFDPIMGPLTYYDPPFRNTMQDATLRLAGPVWTLPGGSANLALLLEHQSEEFAEGRNIATIPRLFPSRSQSVSSAYMEARIPLFTDKNKRRGLELLELQVAGRRDQYTVNGVTGNIIVGSTSPIERRTSKADSTNPTVGLRYQPLPDLMLRASYGTGFLPPTVNQIVPGSITNFVGVIDPRRGNTASGLIQTQGGGSPSIRPENSKSWSAGAILTPRFIPGLRLSVDYTLIHKTDNIALFATSQQLVDNESLFPERVIRGPVQPGDPFGIGPITFLNTSVANFAQAKAEAYDLQLDYRKETSTMGTFDFLAIATWQTHYQTQFLPSSPLVENVGISSAFPLKFKANASLLWKRGAWNLGWSARYFDSYIVSTNATVVLNHGGQRVSSQVYHDVFASYRFNRSGHSGSSWMATPTRILTGMEVQAGIKNLFNTSPPFDAAISGSRYYSPYGDPRLASYYISVKRTF